MSVLDTIKLNRKKTVVEVDVFGVKLQIHKLNFGKTLELSKQLSSNDKSEIEQTELLISSMVTDSDGNYIFSTPEGIEILRASDVDDVKLLVEKCAEVAGFQLEKQVDLAQKN